jgi:coniferyl-aldehyde dehydrogenase
MADGTFRLHLGDAELGGFCALGTFADRMVVSEYSVIKLADDVDYEVGALLGCAVPAGWGSAVRAARVNPGDTVVVLGAGGVGLNAVQGAALAGALRVVVVDPNPFKRESAMGFGATHTFDSPADASSFLSSATRGRMADHCIVTVGVLAAEHINDAVDIVGKRGQVVLISVGPMTETAIQLNAIVLEGFEKVVRGSLFGSCQPTAAIGSIEHLRRNLEAWMVPYEVPASLAAGMPTTADVTPLGVVGVIGPWNFPVSLVVQPAAEAIAAGNRVMIKFSDVNVRAGAILAQAIEAEFAPEELAVINGGLDVATAFSALPFDHLFFTGSPAVGRLVQRAAADNLTPVTLELGGKNPVVVARDADLSVAAERIAAGRLVNGGQVCLCPDYVFVPRERMDEFVDKTRAAFLTLYPEFPTNPTVTAIVNDKNFDRVTNLTRDAVDKGASAVLGVTSEDEAKLPDPATRRIAPTLLLNVDESMAVAQEEVFGPVLAVYPYDDVSEAIDFVRNHPSPLVAYWYGEDTPDFHEFRRRTASGSITRNDFAVHLSLPDVPLWWCGTERDGELPR